VESLSHELEGIMNMKTSEIASRIAMLEAELERQIELDIVTAFLLADPGEPPGIHAKES